MVDSEKTIEKYEDLEIATNLPPSAEDLIKTGDLISQSLMFALKRSYLRSDVIGNHTVQIDENALPNQLDAAFIRIDQVGKPVEENFENYFSAIQTALAASHDKRYTFVYFITNDSVHAKIYLGVVAKEEGSQPRIFAEHMGEFLCSNWPGTKTTLVEDYSEVVRCFHQPVGEHKYAHCFTGIPSLKNDDKHKDAFQSIDQFMRGLRNKPYVYLVIADPVAENEVENIIQNTRTLGNEVHAFIKTTIQKSASTGTSQTKSTSDTTSESESLTEGTSTSETTGKSKGVIGTTLEKAKGAKKGLVGLGAAALGGAFYSVGGAFLLSGMIGMFGQLLPSTTASETIGDTTSSARTTGTTTGTTDSIGDTTSESLSFGQDYLNKHAEASEKLLEKIEKRFEQSLSGGCWNVGVYLISDQIESSAQGQAQLKALVSGIDTTMEPMRSHNISTIWNESAQVFIDAFQQPPFKLVNPENHNNISHPLGSYFSGLTTPLNTLELSLLANLPLKEMTGIPSQPTAYFSLNPPVPQNGGQILELGDVLEGGTIVGNLKYDIDLNSLNRHIFITGVTGSGKSNTCRWMINNLMNKGVNFMVVEPAKDEYLQMALAINQSGKYNQKIAIFTPGADQVRGIKLDSLRLNPFDIIQLPGASPQVMAHLDRIKSIFNASFPMQEILPVILEEALVDLYDSQGWLKEEIPDRQSVRPTLEQLYNSITPLVKARGYDERITGNIVAALKTRISSLLRGWKGELFNHPHSTPWEDIFDRPVVINLSRMGDDADKGFTMALLLNFMYEYRLAQHEAQGSPENQGLRNLAIFEEAHRILRYVPKTAESANPLNKMGEMFADILAEIRVYGQGLGIIDQIPSKLIPDVLKNTNIKIIHRLVAADDREAMASALALTKEQSQVIARLKTGQAIVSGVHDDSASWVQIGYSPIPIFKN